MAGDGGAADEAELVGDSFASGVDFEFKSDAEEVGLRQDEAIVAGGEIGDSEVAGDIGVEIGDQARLPGFGETDVDGGERRVAVILDDAAAQSGGAGSLRPEGD